MTKQGLIAITLCSLLTGCIELEQGTIIEDEFSDANDRENVTGGEFVLGYSDEGFFVGDFLDPNFELRSDGQPACTTRRMLGLSEQILNQVSCMLPPGTFQQVDLSLIHI